MLRPQNDKKKASAPSSKPFLLPLNQSLPDWVPRHAAQS